MEDRSVSLLACLSDIIPTAHELPLIIVIVSALEREQLVYAQTPFPLGFGIDLERL